MKAENEMVTISLARLGRLIDCWNLYEPVMQILRNHGCGEVRPGATPWIAVEEWCTAMDCLIADLKSRLDKAKADYEWLCNAKVSRLPPEPTFQIWSGDAATAIPFDRIASIEQAGDGVRINLRPEA